MAMKAQMEQKLKAMFAPTDLDVIDESEQHRGHGGWREGGETHFRVRMVSAGFSGQSRVARQRAVNSCLKEELATTVHALAMELSAPDDP
ncbi:MAG: BolA family protein [Pseudomonadota bacterium]